MGATRTLPSNPVPTTTTSGTYRRIVAAGAAVLVAGAALAAVPAVVPAAAAAEPSVFSPFDNAGGFTVYVRDDATLAPSEIEGALAVGGTLTATTDRLTIRHYSAGTWDYAPPLIDGDRTRLLIGSYSQLSGITDVSGDGQSTKVGAAKLVALDPSFDFVQTGDYTRYEAPAPSGAKIDGKNQPWNADPSAGWTTEQDSVAAYVEQGDSWAADRARLAAITSPESTTAHHVTVAEDGGKARLDLEPGVTNVVEYGDLFFGLWQASQITYKDVAPSADTPVIVHVPAGTTNVQGMPFGDSGRYAPYVMWDLSSLTGAVTMTGPGGQPAARSDGSVYAPDAALTLSAGPLDGQVIARTLTVPQGAGEMHAYLFTARLTADAVPGEEPGEETPGEETPGDETPGEETPGDETPGEETPGDETPGEETPGEETPGEETPGGETPGDETPGEETPGEQTPGETPGDEIPGDETPGEQTSVPTAAAPAEQGLASTGAEVGPAIGVGLLALVLGAGAVLLGVVARRRRGARH